MQYDKRISDMRPGDEVEGFYLLRDAVVKTSTAGKPFLSGTVADRTGSIDIKVWDYTGALGRSPADAGSVIKLRAAVTEFKGTPQLNVSRIRPAAPDDSYDLTALVPTAPIDAAETLAQVRALIATIEDSDLRDTLRSNALRGIIDMEKMCRRLEHRVRFRLQDLYNMYQSICKLDDIIVVGGKRRDA